MGGQNASLQSFLHFYSENNFTKFTLEVESMQPCKTVERTALYLNHQLIFSLLKNKPCAWDHFGFPQSLYVDMDFLYIFSSKVANCSAILVTSLDFLNNERMDVPFVLNSIREISDQILSKNQNFVLKIFSEMLSSGVNDEGKRGFYARVQNSSLVASSKLRILNIIFSKVSQKKVEFFFSDLEKKILLEAILPILGPSVQALEAVCMQHFQFYKKVLVTFLLDKGFCNSVE